MILVAALMFVDVETGFASASSPCPHHGFANLGQLGQRLHRPPPEVQNLAEGPGAATCLSAMSPSHWIVSMYGSMPYAICININMHQYANHMLSESESFKREGPDMVCEGI